LVLNLLHDAVLWPVDSISFLSRWQPENYYYYHYHHFSPTIVVVVVVVALL